MDPFQNTVLFDTFVGEYVKITFKTVITDGNLTIPMSANGYLLEEDGMYFYLGDDNEEVSFAIKKREIAMIEIIKEESMFDDVLVNMPTPTKKEDIN